MLLTGTHNDRLHDRSFFHLPVRGCLFYSGRHHVAEVGAQSRGSAQRQDHLQLAGAGIVGDLEHGPHHHCHKKLLASPLRRLARLRFRFLFLSALHLGFYFRTRLIGHQRGLAYHVLQPPALEFRKRPGLFEQHKITYSRRVLLVVRVELLRALHHSPVQAVRIFARNFHHDRLLHLGGEHFADQRLAAQCLFFIWTLGCGFYHSYFSLSAASSCSRRTVLMRAMSLRSPRIFFRLSVCPISNWKRRRKSWSVSSCSWCFSSTSVWLRIFSAFIIFLVCACPVACHQTGAQRQFV